MKKQNLKTNKGITLIALVITIVVLLILAIVSIQLVINGGIVKHAEEATSEYAIEEEKERIALAYSEYKMAKISNPSANLQVEGVSSVSGDENNGWTVKFDKTSNTYKIDKEGNITYVETGKEEEIVITSEKDLTMVGYFYNTMYNPNQPEIFNNTNISYEDDENNDRISDINSELPAFLTDSAFDIPVTFFTETIPTEGDIAATITHYDGTEEKITLTTTDNKKWVYESEESPFMNRR